MGKLSAFPASTGPGLTDQVIMIVGGVDVKVSLQTLLGLLIPSGSIIEFGGSGSVPSGYLLCDGSQVSRTTYAALFTAIGVTHGAGDGSTTFNLPDHRGRVAVGKNAASFATLGGTGGEETHVLTQSEMPAHNHGVNDPGHLHNIHIQANSAAGGTSRGSQGSNSNSDPAGTGITLNNAGGGTAHNNMPPYIVVNHIIKT